MHMDLKTIQKAKHRLLVVSLVSVGVLLVAGFSVGGTEVVAVTAGESDDPKKSMPKAIKQVFWRILLFYVLSIAVIGAIIPYTDPSLLRASSSISQSPFTIVFDRVGIAFAASVINAVILTSLLSAANSGVYTTGRMLYSLSSDKKAPKFLSKLNKTTKLPLRALLTTYAVVVIVIIYANFNSNAVFNLLEIIGSNDYSCLGSAFGHKYDCDKLLKNKVKILIRSYHIKHLFIH